MGHRPEPASHAVHYIIRQRILDKELGIHRDGSMKSNTDNLATLQIELSKSQLPDKVSAPRF